MKKLTMMFAVGAAILMTGCSVTKVEYSKNDKGETSYRIYRNDHWLKTSASGLRGGMTDAGKFEFSADGMEASPSEEFNRTMQTYTTAFIQLAQIAAAAYNPSASGTLANSVKTAAPAATATPAATTATAPAATTAATQPTDGSSPATAESLKDANSTLKDANAECTDCTP